MKKNNDVNNKDDVGWGEGREGTLSSPPQKAVEQKLWENSWRHTELWTLDMTTISTTETLNEGKQVEEYRYDPTVQNLQLKTSPVLGKNTTLIYIVHPVPLR